MTPLALFLLGCATVFLGTVQAAFSALMRLWLRLMAERGRRDDSLGHYLDDPLQLFLPVRILIGVCTVLAGALIARLSDIHDSVSVATFIVSLVAFVVVCEHILPMVIVRLVRSPEAVLEVLLLVFHPVAQILRPVTVTILRVIGDRREVPNGTTDTGIQPPEKEGEQDEGTISQEESRELLQSIVDFTETIVREVMTPRPDIVAIPVDATIQDLRTLFREEQYSRMPVFRDNLDNILGIVFVKDLVALPPGAEPPMTTMMRSAYFVPESKRVSELLKEMQRRQLQMAIVVDEYGGTGGLVTVEDLLEEIVGEIRDEYDVEGETVTDEGYGVFVFSGKVSVDEVRDRLGVEIQREGFETLGGYLLSSLGRMPYVGEVVDIDELSLEVLEVERRRVTKVRARRTKDAATAAQQPGNAQLPAPSSSQVRVNGKSRR
jgi:putative hemolysin